MKTINYSLAAAAAALLLAPGSAWAFHSGGVAECEGCHTMHNTKTSGRGVPGLAGEGQGAIYLLQGSDQSSTCLNCHNAADTAPSSYHISTDDSMLAPGKAPVEMTPGGDFAWLKKTYTFSLRGTPTLNDGASHGHNIVAADYGYVADPTNTTAPGGTYPADKLSCTSCHNPHSNYRRLADGSVVSSKDPSGNPQTTLPIFGSGSYNNSAAPIAGVSAVGVYRFLGGTGYQPKSLSGSYAFANMPPVAVAPSTYNRSEGVSQTHVAYGSGMSEWCANCHTAMLESSTVGDQYQSGVAGHRHPAGNNAKLTAAIVANYNSYVSSGNMSNTDPTKAYSTLAPFELGVSNTQIATLQSLAVTTDTVDHSATTSGNVMCLSCHRAHASGFAEGTRFFLENEFMTTNSNGAAIYDPNAGNASAIAQGLSAAEQQAAYYGRPATFFGPNARNYCNKCHAKD